MKGPEAPESSKLFRSHKKIQINQGNVATLSFAKQKQLHFKETQKRRAFQRELQLVWGHNLRCRLDFSFHLFLFLFLMMKDLESFPVTWCHEDDSRFLFDFLKLCFIIYLSFSASINVLFFNLTPKSSVDVPTFSFFFFLLLC